MGRASPAALLVGLAMLGLILLASAPAAAAPYLPASDATVLETLPGKPGDPVAAELRRLRASVAAAPTNAAAAALLVSQGISDPDSVKAALEQTAERLGGAAEGGRNDTDGNGLIQPAAALTGLGFNQGPAR